MNRESALIHYAKILKRHCPPETNLTIAHWIVDLKVDFKITPSRKTKLGDFRPAYKSKRARITINGDINKYSFLVTTIHEFAHLGCHLKHGTKVSPHGKEWKAIYTELLGNFVNQSVFPKDMGPALKAHLSSPSASSCSCPIISRALAQHDSVPGVFLDDLPMRTEFLLGDKRFVNLEKRRSRFLCLEPISGKQFLISGNAKVILSDAP